MPSTVNPNRSAIPGPPAIAGILYVIQASDTLYSIAERELGDGQRWREILHPNGRPFTEREANNLQAGQPVYLPTPHAVIQPGLTAEQKRRAEQITSVFENDTVELQYDYVEDIGDGRGFTCGRAGFTTATGDAVLVVARYTRAVPGNRLARYLTPLEQLAKAESDDTSQLQGFDTAWRKAAQDPAFRAVQDAVVDELYYQPSAKRADQAGLKPLWPGPSSTTPLFNTERETMPTGCLPSCNEPNAKSTAPPKRGLMRRTGCELF